MEAIAMDQKFIPYGLLHYHHAGVTRDDALAHLLKCHESCPEMFPRIDYRDVDFWYKSFEEKNYDLRQVPPYARLTKLENLPVLDHVIHSMNTEDQQSMRGVCKTFKSFIDTEKRIFEKVEFRISSNSTMLKTYSGTNREMIQTVFRMQNEGCEIIKDNERTLCKKNFIRAGLDELKKTVEVIHTKVKHMHIQYNSTRVNEENRRTFIMGTAEVLNGLKNKLHVQKLDLTVRNPDELDAILNGIEPESLNNLTCEISDSERNHSFHLSQVTSWPLHSPNMDQLRIKKHIVDMRIENFSHIPELFLFFETITPEEIMAHKDKMLYLPNMRSHWLGCANQEIDLDTWKTLLGLSNNDFDEYANESEITGNWSIPGDDKHKLQIQLELSKYVAYTLFKFTRKDIE